jgi:hypothetical protein
MKVGHRQQFGLAVGEPLSPGQALALRTMPITAAVAGAADYSAIDATLGMTTKCRRPARVDRAEDPVLAAAKPVAL